MVTMLCRDQGKVEAVARGARRPRNRLVGLTLPFNVLHMSIFTGRGLDELSQAEGIRIFHVLRSDLFLLAYASYLVELTREFLPDREPNDAVFHLLLQSLEGLEDRHAPEDVTRYFELRLLDLAGFRPSLEGCLHCGRPPDEVTAFSPAEGGFFCRACTVAGGDYLALSRVAIAAMLRRFGGRGGFPGPPAGGGASSTQTSPQDFHRGPFGQGITRSHLPHRPPGGRTS